MKTFDPRRYALGVCAVVALLSGCGGSQSPSMLLAPQIAAPQSAAAGPLIVCNWFHVNPRHPTILLGEPVTLRAYLKFRIYGPCGRHLVVAAWNSSGGSLQVIDGGEKAIFSASSLGVYTVVAKYNGFHSRALVTVTSP
ncbi:MAG: hypothetical protein WB810_17310 [Candidatus Cybelea sp.]